MGEFIGRRQVFAVLKALVLEPEDVERHLVPLDEVFIVVAPPVTLWIILAPGLLSPGDLPWLVAGHELVQIGTLERVRLLGEVHIGAKVIDPEFPRPWLLLGGFAVEEKDIGLHAPCIEQSRGEAKKGVAVELAEEVPADGLPRPTLEEDIVGDDYGTATIYLEKRLRIARSMALLQRSSG